MKNGYAGNRLNISGNPKPKTGKWNLWLTLRFLRKQKLRTAAILCGMLFSGFLLTAFGSLGYDFWRRVHSGADGAAEYDSTQQILILLIAVLLLLVTSCTGILLRNLFSLTFSQRWRSLTRLISLGADFRDIFHMEIMGIILLFLAAVPVGCGLAVLLGNRMGIRHEAPFWMTGGVMLWSFLVACICGIKPLTAASRRQEGKGPHPGKSCGKKKVHGKRTRPRFGFLWYVAGRYHHASRGQCLRITVSVIAAILLYVPVGYLIDTNISVQQSGLYERYGIQYNCGPQNQEELEVALQEYRRLADCDAGGSMVCVSLNTRACIKTDAISGELRDALKEAGWKEAGWEENEGTGDGDAQNNQEESDGNSGRSGQDSDERSRERGGDARTDAGSRKEEQVLTVDAAILFVDEETYEQCLQISHKDDETFEKYPQGVGIEESTTQDRREAASAILLNRYTNRSRWSETGDVFFQETPLLADGAVGSNVKAYYDFVNEYEPDTTKYIAPDVIIHEIPEGIDFTGNLSLILPLSSMRNICPSDIRYGMFQVCGKFEDGLREGFGEALFHLLEKQLGEKSLGHLTYTRKVLREWYDSMEGIHRAMNAICLTLFSMAVLNIFSMMIFQYMERKRGLAILWSAGQSLGGLFRLLILENITHFLIGILTGVPLSALLCYYIYSVFRQAWQVTFALPIRQIALISLAALVVSAVALLLDGILLRHQDFLADIMEERYSMEDGHSV